MSQPLFLFCLKKGGIQGKIEYQKEWTTECMNDRTNLKNKKVLVLGLAKSGESAARLLDRLGAIVTVNDGKPFEDNPMAQDLLEDGIRVICGSHPLDLLEEDFALMVKNPGIRYDNPMVERALQKGIPVWTEVELAYLVAEAPIIGITGSNGKTTTTTMIAEVLQAGGQSAKLCGNIGYPASTAAQEARADEVLVMELSSFQLMGTAAFHPRIAVLTNLIPSHLDYHGHFEAYVAAKWLIQKQMTQEDTLVLNFNQEIAKTLAKQTKAQVLPFSTKKPVEGAYLQDGQLYFKGERIMAAADLGVPGEHNIENALATIAVARMNQIEAQVIRESLSSFGGVKHRLQDAGFVQQVRFYNDSKSTNVLATQTALAGFDNRKVVLIAGGLDRNNDLADLVPIIRGLKQMIVLGETASRLKQIAEQAGVPCREASDIADATRKAYEVAEAGEIVLLSPAHASWDMYPNFEVRGDVFLQTVEELRGNA